MEVHGDADPFGPSFDQEVERGTQAKVVEDSRSQFQGHFMRISAHAVDGLLQLAETQAPRGPGGETRFQDFQAERQPGDLLAELVVDLARDAPPLVLLGADQPAQKLGAGVLGPPAFRQVAEQPA
jgi:hypothetical protein